jgi:hypothetical protein
MYIINLYKVLPIILNNLIIYINTLIKSKLFSLDYLYVLGRKIHEHSRLISIELLSW